MPAKGHPPGHIPVRYSDKQSRALGKLRRAGLRVEAIGRIPERDPIPPRWVSPNPKVAITITGKGRRVLWSQGENLWRRP